MYAVVNTGGKQYKVSEDDVLRIEKIEAEAGQIVTLDDVLLVSDNDNVTVGTPKVDGAAVAVEILAQRRARKVVIFKKRRRKSSQRKRGHRQHFTLVRVSEILTNGAKPTKAAQGMPEKATVVSAVSEEKPVAQSGKADDLKLLSGVGPAIAKRLAEAGVTSYQQIADLDEAGIKALDEKANLGGRIEREEWQEQARELMAGKPPRAKVDQEAAKKAD